MQNINGDAAEPLVLEVSEFQALRACFRVAHQIFRLMPAKKVRGVAGP